MVAGLILGSLFAYVRPPKYSSSETLILNQIVGNPYTPNSNSDTLEMLQTEAASVTSEDVLRKVVADTGVGLSTAAIRSRTKVSVPPNTQALQITYTSATRELAPVVVASMAQNFIDYRETLAEEAIQTRDTNIDDQLALQQEELKQLRIDHAGQQALASVRANIIALNQARAENDAQDTTGGRYLAVPLLPKAGKTKHFIVFAIAGMVVVGLFGLGFAVWRERRRDRIRASSDLDDYQFDAPVTAI